jgi:tetratricopeptide (TPR) repeat protein
MDKKLALCILLLLQLCADVLCAREKRREKTSKTWAVVIGISNYKNIEGLNFADRDAQAFYNYLVNTNGGPKLKPAYVKLLLNKQALSTEIYAALEWLKGSVKQNDRVIFYFSGHGDVETKNNSQRAFLLAYNSPKVAYATSGTVGVKYLQQYFDGYISQNRAQCVILIADACRSGKLAGGSEGAQLTTQALGHAKNKRIIKILSAQENEVSFEGSKWGGGVFTYYLLRGIEGLANANSDNAITTKELAAYLPLKVAFATANAQHPHIDGNPQQPLFTFNQQMLTAAKNEKSSPALASGSLGTGIAENIPPDVKKLYEKYLDYLQQRKLVWGDNQQDTINCAKTIYLQLINNRRAEAVRASLGSSFIAALSQRIQEALDKYIKGAKMVAYNQQEILYLKTLINPDMVLYNYLMARICFIESQRYLKEKNYVTYIRKTLYYEKDAPYALNELGYCYYNCQQPDSALYTFKKAISTAPQWADPYVGAGLVYSQMNDHQNEIACYEKVSSFDSTNVAVINNLGTIYQVLNDYNKALTYHKRALQLDTGFYEPLKKINGSKIYYNIAVDYQNLGQPGLAITNDQKATALDSTYIEPYLNEALIYQGLNNFDKAIFNLRKVMQLDSTNLDCNIILGYVYLKNNKLNEGIALLKKALKLNPADRESCYNLACAWSRANDTTISLTCLKKALDNGWQNYNQIMQDDDLANLRKTAEFAQFIRKYFPDKVK